MAFFEHQSVKIKRLYKLYKNESIKPILRKNGNYQTC